MEIATVLFTYNRCKHTERVLNALKKNTLLPEKLYIFQDGVKNQQQLIEWKKVNDIIQKVDWCLTELVISEHNKGLADSIVSGLNYVFEKHDAVIVLEDDCVPHPQFMEFMYACLRKYENEKSVYNVSGYAWPLEVQKNGTDAYFTHRANSWSWGTWKTRWLEYSRDYTILGRIKNDELAAKRLSIWGEDLEGYLLGNIYGNCNSWATFWSLKIIEKNGYCIAPYKSLVENIGFDGTGVHCGTGEIWTDLLGEEERLTINLPEIIELPKQCEIKFANYFAWATREKRLQSYNSILCKWVDALQKGKSPMQYLRGRGIEKVCIWGRGKICDLLLEEIHAQVEVLAIVESKPSGMEHKGIPIVSKENIPQDTEVLIVVPSYDIEKIIGAINELVDTRYQVWSIEELFEQN